MNGDAAARVFIVAPTPFARAGLRAMLAGDGVLVVGEAGSLADHEISGADVLVMVGEELFEEAGAPLGEQAMLLLSDDDRPLPALRELAPSGWGMVSPGASPEEVRAAVAAVVRGLVVLPQTLAGRLFGATATAGEPDEPLDEPLTGREREVLGLLGRGISNKMVARELNISEHTVKFHVSAIYAKIGVRSRAEAVRVAARRGLLIL